MPERNFEFMFYFDLETPVYAPEFLQLMGELPSLCEEFSYLRTYRDVVSCCGPDCWGKRRATPIPP